MRLVTSRRAGISHPHRTTCRDWRRRRCGVQRQSWWRACARNLQRPRTMRLFVRIVILLPPIARHQRLVAPTRGVPCHEVTRALAALVIEYAMLVVSRRRGCTPECARRWARRSVLRRDDVRSIVERVVERIACLRSRTTKERVGRPWVALQCRVASGCAET